MPRSSPLWRRGLLGLAGVGLIYGAVATAVRRREAGHAEQRMQAHANARRAAVAARASHLRPLDPHIRDVPLELELSRRVLGLYNGLDSETDAENNPVHQRAELILNHLGLLVELRDVNDPLPSDQEMARYRGVVAWFGGAALKQPRAYLAWLVRQVEAGRRVVLLDGLHLAQHPGGEPVPVGELAAALEAIGVRPLGNASDDPRQIQVVHKQSEMVEFEHRLPRRLERFEQYRLLDGAGTSYLRLRRADLADSDSDVVVATSRGGFVAQGYAVHEGRFGTNHVMQWRIDPFRFFARALDVEETPRPDFTTLGGARIYYSHIDGDGLESITEVNRKSMCADFTRTEVLEKYGLPVTVSFVVAGIQPPPLGLGTRHSLAVARRIARLPNVEVAVHGFAHPMDWRSRDKAVCSYEVPGYRMDAEREIAQAASFVEQVVNPPGKAVQVMLWTGWCNPAEDQLAIAYREGLYNMNGGDPVFDGQFPSYLHLAPPILRVGRHAQYQTSGPNEYILTEEWTPPYHRWENVIHTLTRAGSPRRVYPLNVYYHFYVVEKPAGLFAMHRVMEWVVRQQPAPLFVSEYIDIVRDFETVRIARAGAETWRVLNSGYLRTIRFDRLDRHVDLGRSRGVIGYRRHPELGALYVHLDESHDHTIVLDPNTPGRLPFVVHANAYVDRLKLGRERASFTMRGFGRKSLTLANLAPSSVYQVTAQSAAQITERLARTDQNGVLHWAGEIDGAAIQVTVARQER